MNCLRFRNAIELPLVGFIESGMGLTVSLARRKGKEKNGEKVAFVGVEPTTSAILVVVLS